MTKQKTDADTRRTDSGECQPPEVLSDPPSTLSESAGDGYEGQRLIDMLCLCGELGGMADDESPTAYLRRLIDARAAPVQAEPVAWDSPSNRNHEPVEKIAKQIYDEMEFTEQGIKPIWHPGGNSDVQEQCRRKARIALRDSGHNPASPPTPVSGERDEDRIQKLARRMFNRFHNPALWDHPRSIMARDNCYDLAREVLYAIPVSAELDDMGKQNGSEKL